jgi:hypothetical protein
VRPASALSGVDSGQGPYFSATNVGGRAKFVRAIREHQREALEQAYPVPLVPGVEPDLALVTAARTPYAGVQGWGSEENLVLNSIEPPF